MRLNIKVLISVFAYLLSVHLYAQSSPASFQLSLSAQPLPEALITFARQSQQAIVYDPASLATFKSPPVNGEYSAAQALNILLKNTGFHAVKLPSGWAIKANLPLDEKEQAKAKPPVTSSELEEVIVVASYADSVRQALAQKQMSAQSKDVILASDMAQFPALNLADALNRMPGVSVERDRGEALFVSVRGLPSQFNQLTLNGHRLASNENARTSTQYGRRFHYDILPTELVESVEVNKTQVAEQATGAIGATVNIRSFTPFTSKQTQNKIKLSASRSELTNKINPRVSVYTNWINPNQDFGVSLSAAYSRRSIRQDRALSFDWNTALDYPRPGQTTYYAATLRPTQEFEQRENGGLNLNLNWQQVHQTFNVNFLSLYKDIDYQEFAYSADYQLADLQTSASEFKQGVLMAGQTERGSVQISAETSGMRDTINSIALNHQIQLNDTLIDWHLVFSQAESLNDEPIQRTRLRLENRAGFSFKFPTGNGEVLPDIDYFKLDLTDPAQFPGRRLEWRIIKADDTQASFTLNVSRPLTWPENTEFKAGISVNQHTRAYRRRDRIITSGIEGEFFNADAFNLNQSGFLSQTNSHLPELWLQPKTHVFWRQLDLTALKKSTTLPADLANSYQIDEMTYSSFTQLDFDYGSLWGNAGVRAVAINTGSQGHYLNGSQSQVQAVNFSHSYQNLLPSVNLVYEVDNHWQWRGAVAKTFNRPDLPDLSPRITFNSGDIKTALQGNPLLKPTQAWQFDLGLFYYAKNTSYYGVNGFLKALTHFVQPAFFTAQFDGVEYQVETSSNGANASVRGIELIAQHSFYDVLFANSEFGFSANLTLTDSTAEYIYADGVAKKELAQVAKTTFNAELFYEIERWAFRANYNYTGDILQEIAQATQPARYKDDFGFLGARVSYRFNDDISLFIEGLNLLNQAESEYVLDGYFTNYSYYGRTFMAGVQFAL